VSEPVGTRVAKNTTTYQMSTLLPLLVTTRATTTTTTTPTFDDIPLEVLTQHIIPMDNITNIQCDTPANAASIMVAKNTYQWQNK
jgi:hypothetical protein